jgi:DNA-binding transcriptional ArsR family regulator
MTYAMRQAQALAALGDPTRRAIFERVARRPAAVGEIAREMPVSRPAVSQHLRVLKEASLVTESNEGARRIYRLDPRGIAAMREWLDAMWSAALAEFAAFADAEDVPPPPEEGKSK